MEEKERRNKKKTKSERMRKGKGKEGEKRQLCGKRERGRGGTEITYTYLITIPIGREAANCGEKRIEKRVIGKQGEGGGMREHARGRAGGRYEDESL